MSGDEEQPRQEVSGASPRGDAEQLPEQEKTAVPGGVTLYVSGLAHALVESDVRALFEPYGTLVRVQVVMDPHTRQNRGFGFVSFEDDAMADAAIEALNRKDHMGRYLAIERAKRDRPRSPTPGRYHGPRQSDGRRRDDDRRGRDYDNRGPDYDDRGRDHDRRGRDYDRRDRGYDRDSSYRRRSRSRSPRGYRSADRYEPTRSSRYDSYGAPPANFESRYPPPSAPYARSPHR